MKLFAVTLLVLAAAQLASAGAGLYGPKDHVVEVKEKTRKNRKVAESSGLQENCWHVDNPHCSVESMYPVLILC
jgi:predicted porin